MPENVKRRPV